LTAGERVRAITSSRIAFRGGIVVAVQERAFGSKFSLS